MKSQKTEEKR